MKRQHFFWLLGVAFASSLLVAACTDDSLMQPEDPVESASEVASSPASPLAAALGTGQCMGNDAVESGVTSGFANDPLAFNCTANDVRIANARTQSGDPIQCVPGEILTGVDIVADIVETSTSVRHDIGIWIESEDNMGGGAEDGTCNFFYFDEDDIDGEAGVVDGDGDQCGDMENAGTVEDFGLGDLTLVCPTDPVVQDGMTFIQVNSCVSWTQPGGDRTCPLPDTESPDAERFGTLPANKSKCNCEPFLVEVEILAQLKLVKTVTNDDGGSAEADDWTLSATSQGSDASNDFSNAGGSGVFNNVFPDVGYALAEADGESGYSTGSWSCDGGSLSGSTVTLSSGDVVTCTINNDDIAPTLKLVKTVTNDDGGSAAANDWSLTATGSGGFTEQTPAAADATAQDVTAGVEYTLSESGPGGYTAGSWSCNGGTQNGDKITLALDEDVTCTINNDDAAAMLKLVKSVTNDDGGSDGADDWTLSATSTGSDASRDFSNAGGSGTFQSVFTNTGYTLAESPNPGAGYSSTGQWSCDGGSLSAGNTVITLSANDQVTCTITNDDIAPTLKLVKTVTNDDGGGDGPDDWTLSATSTGSDASRDFSNAGGSGVFETVFANVGYTLAESGPGGYTAGSWSCDGGDLSGSTVTLALDDDVTCTINNDDIAPTLKLVKTVTNNDGGSAAANDWSLTATGSGGFTENMPDASTATATTVTAGVTYALSESGPIGYTAGSWSCTGGGVQSGANITLSLDEDVTCTINNDDIPQECESGDRLTSVSLQLIAGSPDPLFIQVTDDNGPNPAFLSSSPGDVSVSGTFTIVPDGGATFFDSQNLRFWLEGAESKDLKVHLSCSDDPAVGDIHSGSANGASATLQKTGFSATQFN